MGTRCLSAVAMLLLSSRLFAAEPIRTEPFEFSFDGTRLSGVLGLPVGRSAVGLVVLVHGHGKTDAVAGKWYLDLRSHFAELGLASLMWDKAGCGRSGGGYDHNQSVQSGAKEVVAAITELKRRGVAGTDRIGLWGISRAGWICPLVIEALPSIAFWISVSGTDDKESFGYLLETNLRIEGRSAAEARALAAEWRRGLEVFRKGGSWADNQEATRSLRQDPFFNEFFGEQGTEEAYRTNQQKFVAEKHPFDEASGLMIYVANFCEKLEKIHCPVLALFGEKDSIVDWRSTIALYEQTIGRDDGARLTIKTFPACNHNLQRCQTGGFRETRTARSQPACDGYFEAITDWLQARVLASDGSRPSRRP